MRFTIFTPTYNRAYSLQRLFDSLTKQEFKDFEWLIIDDGSEDDTEQLIQSFIQQNIIKINFFKTKNGGKHRAINYGIQFANGELFFIVDSDDKLPADSLKIIDKIEKTISNKEKFAGVCGLKAGFDCTSLGNELDNEIIDMTHIERTNKRLDADMAEVFYTSILKKYPFPTFDGELFIQESTVWNRIANDEYKLRYFNEIVYLCEYQPNGLSSSIKEIMLKNPRGVALHLIEEIKFYKYNKYKKRSLLFNYYSQYKMLLSKKQICEYLNIKMFILNLIIFYYKIRNFFKK